MNSSVELAQYVAMEEYLKGRRCIITGASGTIGKIFATFVASRGGIPILVDVVPQDDTAAAVASYGGEYSVHRVDLSDVAQINHSTLKSPNSTTASICSSTTPDCSAR